MSRRRTAPFAAPLAALLVLAVAGCASTAAPVPALPTPAARAAEARLAGDPGRPSEARWVRTELYFGLGPDDGMGAEAAGWPRFLAEVVSPRFPDGLTVIAADGQWLARGEREPRRLRSVVLVLLHEGGPAREADLEAIRAEWKARTGHQSVLRVDQPATVSF